MSRASALAKSCSLWLLACCVVASAIAARTSSIWSRIPGAAARDHPRTHVLGGARQQLAKQMQRHVGAQPDFLGQLLVAPGMVHQGRETALGEFRAGILGELVKDIAVAALQQDIGDAFADASAGRDRQEVRLAFGAGDFDEIAVVEARRLRQDRCRHRDIVIAGQTLHHAERCVVDRRQPAAELAQRFALDFPDQMIEDVIEHADLLIVEPVCFGNEQIGDPPQSVEASVRRTALDYRFQFDDR